MTYRWLRLMVLAYAAFLVVTMDSEIADLRMQREFWGDMAAKTAQTCVQALSDDKNCTPLKADASARYRYQMCVQDLGAK